MAALKYRDPTTGNWVLLSTAGPAGPSGAPGPAGPAGALVVTAIKTSAFTFANSDFVRVDATSASITGSVPSNPAVGFQFAVTLIAVSGANYCSIVLGGTDRFQSAVGPTSINLTARDQVLYAIYAGGNVWSVIEAPQLPLVSGYATTPNTSNPAQVGVDVLSNVQTFTTIGAFTWVMPSWATASSLVTVELVGGGGGGGSGRRGATGTIRGGGGGGQAGFRSKAEFVAGDLPGTVSGQVGQSAAGGAAPTVDSTDGVAGNGGGAINASWFGKYVYASGGAGGAAGTATDGGVGGTTLAGARGMWPGAPGAKGGGVANAQDLNVTEFGVFTAGQLTPNPIGSGGGGGGGGRNAANTVMTASAGGDVNGYADGTVVGGAGGTGALGGAGGTAADAFTGSGGGGAGRDAVVKGGDGAIGAGGGGGGGFTNGANGAQGGNGGNGIVRVTTRP